MFFYGNIGKIGRFYCRAVEASGGNGTPQAYLFGQNVHAFQKCGDLRWAVVTVDGLQWPVITVDGLQWPEITVGLNRQIIELDVLGRDG